jgi:hypothetical protein
MPACCALYDLYVAFRQVKTLGEQDEQRFVGCAIDGWGRQAHFKRLIFPL